MTNELECTWIMLMVHRKLVSQIVSNVLNVISYHESLNQKFINSLFRSIYINRTKIEQTLVNNVEHWMTDVDYFTICAMPLLVIIYLAWIRPYNISAACSIKSLWLGFSSSSSSEKVSEYEIFQVYITNKF